MPSYQDPKTRFPQTVLQCAGDWSIYIYIDLTYAPPVPYQTRFAPRHLFSQQKQQLKYQPRQPTTYPDTNPDILLNPQQKQQVTKIINFHWKNPDTNPDTTFTLVKTTT
jgi:hypothetical protein